MATLESPPASLRISATSTSLRILAGAVVLLFFYYAAGVVITVLLSVLLAYFLDPAVELLERMHVPRTMGSLIMVLLLIAVLGAVGYSLWVRSSDFAANWPRSRDILREAAGEVQGKISGLEGSVDDLTAPTGAPKPSAPSPDSGTIHTLFLRGIGSLYALVLEGTFVPFLVFFMLAGKREAWHSTLQLFPISRRTQVKETLDDLRNVLRDYLIGMTVVTLVVIACSSFFFWALGFDYPILGGITSGLFNMVPYIGAVLAWLPGFFLAVLKWKAISHFGVIAIVLTGIHVVAQNLIAPQLVGRQVQLNAVAITISLLFWGWVWGGMGLILAIPITAALRVICDHTQSWKPVARWLSA
ncbi:MAG TPA: AI-2E family transporter [Candidatus Eremiobacteraceae bacterium]|nr:AI-2E family transporter [Candidatus Eremiobacteraceae bacterium]